jgi:flotillin
MFSTILSVGLPVIAVLVVIALLCMGYVKSPPDTAYIISGLRKKVVIGKAAIRIPFFERIDKVSLKLIPIDVKTSSAVPTADYINIRVDAVVNVKVSDEIEKLKLAAQNFLNQKPEYIAAVAREVLEGNMREIVGQMRLEEMVSDRQKFAEMVKKNAEPDLAGMGLDVISFNVQNFIDDNQVIENLGVDNIVQISKNAAVSRAKAEKEIAVAQANAAKEANDAKVAAELEIANAKAKAAKEKAIVQAQANKESQEAQIAADTQIALKQNELEIQKAELQKEVDTKQAIADAAKGIQAEEQRKVQEIATANANLARQEKEIELQARAVEITERKLEAEVKKTAEAKKYAAEQQADAKLYTTQKESEAELFERQKKAEAEKFEAIQQAEALKAKAEAQKVAMENEAAGIAAKGKAEAEAIQAKALAEAEGILKKAEAMKQYGEAAQMDMQLEAIKVYFEQLPAIAAAIGQGYNGVDKIVMLGGESSKLSGDIINNVTQISEGLSQSMGIDLKSLLAGVIGGKVGAQMSDSE